MSRRRFRPGERKRSPGTCVACSLVATVGGFTPFLSTGPTQRIGDEAGPGVWLSAPSFVCLTAILIDRRVGAGAEIQPVVATGASPRITTPSYHLNNR